MMPISSTSWQKGQSGNRRGRPKRAASLAEHLRYQLAQVVGEDGKTTRAEELARVLLGVALEGDVAAIKLVFERTEGKPAAAVELTGPDGQSLVDIGALRAAFLAAKARDEQAEQVTVYALPVNGRGDRPEW